jgi:hypothetical protein
MVDPIRSENNTAEMMTKLANSTQLCTGLKLHEFAEPNDTASGGVRVKRHHVGVRRNV